MEVERYMCKIRVTGWFFGISRPSSLQFVTPTDTLGHIVVALVLSTFICRSIFTVELSGLGSAKMHVDEGGMEERKIGIGLIGEDEDSGRDDVAKGRGEMLDEG